MSARAIRRRRQRERARLDRRGRAVIAAGSAVAALAIAAPGAEAAQFTVTDPGDAGAGTLRDAIDQANTAPSDDTIVFAASLSGDTITLNTQLLAYTGSGYGDLSIDGLGASQLAVSGGGTTPVLGAGGDGALEISGLTLEDGYSGYAGAGLYAIGDVTLSDMAITGNQSFKYGGGAFIVGAASLDGVTISDNQTGGVGGGATIFSYSPAGGDTTITNSTITGNTATASAGSYTYPTAGGGLALFNGDAQPATISNTEISGNTARYQVYAADGGGLATIGRVTINGSQINDNKSAGPGAGGIDSGAKYALGLSMTDTTVSGNTSATGAGGIDALGRATISRSTISGNSGGVGGVLAYTCPCYGSYGADISNSTVYGNHAEDVSGAPGPTGYGGGVYLGGPYQSTISNSTITANTATNGGGGVFTYGNDGGGSYDIAPRAISSTIVAGNSAGGSPNDLAEEHVGPAFGFTAGNSLIQNKGSAPVISDPAGSNIFNTSPELRTLADNGGPTLTQRPLASSPAINAGRANGLTVDQRGLPRTNAGGTDIGSVELVDVTPPTTTITSGPADGATVGRATVSFGFDADEPATFECSFDGAAFAACSSPVTYPGLSEGHHSFSVRATDSEDNTGPAATRTFTVDTTAPTTTITSGPADGEVVGKSSVSFGFDADEPATFECSFDGAAFAACSSPAGYSGLAQSEHTFRVRATDSEDNTGPAATRTFTVTKLTCEGETPTILAQPGVPTTGTSGPDVIVGTGGPDEISSLGGDDVVCGLGGDDQINAGNGDDATYGGAGKDAMRGGDGDDALIGNEGADTLDGLAGDDLLGGGAGTDTLMGRAGDDELRGRNAADLLQGGNGDDLLASGNGADVAKGGGGADLIRGANGADELRGAGGDDSLHGAGANDSLFGGAGANHLNGGVGKNTCVGGPDPGNVLKNCN